MWDPEVGVLRRRRVRHSLGSSGVVLLAGIRGLGVSAGGSHSLSGGRGSAAVRNFSAAQRRFLGLLVLFPPSVCSMLELQLAALLGKFLSSTPPQLDETMLDSSMISFFITC